MSPPYTLIFVPPQAPELRLSEQAKRFLPCDAWTRASRGLRGGNGHLRPQAAQSHRRSAGSLSSTNSLGMIFFSC